MWFAPFKHGTTHDLRNYTHDSAVTAPGQQPMAGLKKDSRKILKVLF